MIPAQDVGHAAAVFRPDHVYAPTVPFNTMQTPVTFSGKTYTYQTAQPTMYHAYTAIPVVPTMYATNASSHAVFTVPTVYATNATVSAMQYPVMINNTNDIAGTSLNRMLQ